MYFKKHFSKGKFMFQKLFRLYFSKINSKDMYILSHPWWVKIDGCKKDLSKATCILHSLFSYP